MLTSMSLARKPLILAKYRLPLHRQAGLSMIIALIVLVAMTLGAIAIVRSVDTTNLIAGNLAFQQAATHAGNAGVEKAIAWLESCKTDSEGCSLNSDNATNGYAAAGSIAAHNPAAGQTWDAFWNTDAVSGRKKSLAPDGLGNTVSYIIDRLCMNAGPSAATSSGCRTSPIVIASAAEGGDGQENGKIGVERILSSAAYYRITVRTAGPKNTVSYIQAMISM